MTTMDVNRVGLYIGVLALILAVPLAVVPNLLTPRIREWYSTTSQKRLRNRMSVLEEKLQTVENQWEFTPAEWSIYAAALRESAIVIFAVYVLFLAASIVAVAYLGAFSRSSSYLSGAGILVAGLSLLGGMGNAFLAGMSMVDYRNNRDMHSAMGRVKLKNEMTMLRTRLK